jgi:hypothetical protein
MWRYAAAQATGASHLRADAPCQDRYVCADLGDTIIVAVSDGAGSASLSQVGAEIAVLTAVEALRADVPTPAPEWRNRVIDAATAARRAVLGEALAANRSPRDYACTLLLAVLDENGGAAIQIGDGLIAYRDHEAWGWLFWPQKGEYANTTHFLTEENAEQLFESASIREPIDELAVMTDGLEGLALHLSTRTVHEPFLEAVMGPLRKAQNYGEAPTISAALSNFLKSERIASRTDDDLTLVIVARAVP